MNILAVSEALSFSLSVIISSFISGTKWGNVRQELRDLTTRLARIEGMFEFKLKDEHR